MVSERNWLDVYPYTGWGGNAHLPVFQVGQVFQPAAIELKDVSKPWIDELIPTEMQMHFDAGVQVP